MPIMAAHSRSDARGTARLLAHMALNSIVDPSPKPEGEVQVGLNNVSRLLRAFRNDVFFGHELDAFPRSQGPAGNLTLRPPVERNVRDVRSAIDRAISAAFPGRLKNEAIDTVEGVLRSIANPKSGKTPANSDLNSAKAFFEKLIEGL